MKGYEQLQLWVVWLVASIMGTLLGYAVGGEVWCVVDQCPVAPPNSSFIVLVSDPVKWLMVTGLFVGLFMGMTQWLVLRSQMEMQLWGWLLASTLGWCTGPAMAELIANLSGSSDPFALFPVPGIVAGIFIGVPQGLIWRASGRRSLWWILASMVSGVLTNALQIGSLGILHGVLTGIPLVHMVWKSDFAYNDR